MTEIKDLLNFFLFCLFIFLYLYGSIHLWAYEQICFSGHLLQFTLTAEVNNKLLIIWVKQWTSNFSHWNKCTWIWGTRLLLTCRSVTPSSSTSSTSSFAAGVIFVRGSHRRRLFNSIFGEWTGYLLNVALPQNQDVPCFSFHSLTHYLLNRSFHSTPLFLPWPISSFPAWLLTLQVGRVHLKGQGGGGWGCWRRDGGKKRL